MESDTNQEFMRLELVQFEGSYSGVLHTHLPVSP